MAVVMSRIVRCHIFSLELDYLYDAILLESSMKMITFQVIVLLNCSGSTCIILMTLKH